MKKTELPKNYYVSDQEQAVIGMISINVTNNYIELLHCKGRPKINLKHPFMICSLKPLTSRNDLYNLYLTMKLFLQFHNLRNNT